MNMELLKKWMGIKPMMILGLACLISCSDNDEPGTSSENDTPKPISEVNVPKRNPYLAAEHYSITHFNSAQTDAFPYSVKEGTFKVDIDKCPMTWSGPVNLMTLSSTNSDYMWGMASDRVSYIYIGNGSFEKVAEAAYPTVSTKSQEDLEKLIAKYNSVNELSEVAKDILGSIPQIAMASGNYVLCDKDNYAYTNSLSRIIRYKLTDPNDPSKGITLDKEIDMKNYFSNINTLVGLSMTYDGYLVATFASGIAIVDRTLSNVVAQYALPADQTLSNSISIDENNGIYLASNSTTPNGEGLMQKIVWTGSQLSTETADGAWSSTYEGGPAVPSIKMGYGTGSTPTLMGFGDDEDKLVVITDGAQQMDLIAFWRNEIPDDAVTIDPENPRIAGKIGVTCGLEGQQWIQSEQSVVVAGYGAFVVNNISDEITSPLPDKIIGILSVGPLLPSPTGVERFQWNTKTNEWESVWARPDISSISMIPSVSRASNMVFVNGYTETDGWEVTGLNWDTGATTHRVIFGDTNRGNGAYAIIQYLENGDLLFNSVAGPLRVNIQ